MESNAIEVKTTTIELETGDTLEQSLLYERESGLYFCLDASYVEQSVGKITSPYGHGTILLEGESDDGIFSPDIIMAEYGGDRLAWGEHPKYPREDWRMEVYNEETTVGYWEWVSAGLIADNVSNETVNIKASIETNSGDTFRVEPCPIGYFVLCPSQLDQWDKQFINEDDAWSYLNRLVEAVRLWQTLADTPIDENDCLDSDWHVFLKGVEREHVWHWFESTYGIRISEQLQLIRPGFLK